MPRPQSEITGLHGTSVRLTREQQVLFRKLGGAAWMREQLEKERKKHERLKLIGRGIDPRGGQRLQRNPT